ncbi:MAG: SufS family cysteine desulfurase [Bdellovibrionaceae bacterium]|nr:SufS family cysteine desulfurase [Pseudobdellovibrionaceae bacterium]
MGMPLIRDQFPQLLQRVNGQRLVYLDSAATTLKPQVVIERLTQYYTSEVSNVHRGAHYFSNQATENFEKSRQTVARFVGASAPEEIVFTSGTTDALNLLAYALDSVADVRKGEGRDEIVLTEEEHHSNIVPWYWFAKRHGLKIRTIPFNEKGVLELDTLKTLITEKTLLVSCVHMSNTLGTLNDVQVICARAQEVGALSIVDAAQSVSFVSLSVQEIGCDFLCFSSHKLFGPEGLGVLYGRKDLLNSMGYYRGGGSMISSVSFDEIQFLPAPQKFEAGTPSIGAVIALRTAIDFFNEIPKDELQSHERSLVHTTHEMLSEIPGYQPLGDVSFKHNILSFNIDGCHPADLGALIDEMGVAVRVGHHCTQPIMDKMGVSATLRASFSIYNNGQDCLAFVEALKKAREMLL